MFLVECPGGRRTREVLEKIILEHVEKGTTIHTDCWSAYNHLGDLGISNMSNIFYIFSSNRFIQICQFGVTIFMDFRLHLAYSQP